MATDYANAEASHIESYLNSNVDSKHFGQLLKDPGWTIRR